MTFEYQRSNAQMLELAQMQESLLGKRKRIESTIIEKRGTNDEADWEEL